MPAVTLRHSTHQISLFNMLGRFFWASTSDLISRKNTYFCSS